jgi:hypothetical protein
LLLVPTELTEPFDTEPGVRVEVALLLGKDLIKRITWGLAIF